MAEAESDDVEQHDPYHGNATDLAVGDDRVSPRETTPSRGGDETVDTDSILRFVEAVTLALPVLELDQGARGEVEALTSQITELAHRPDPDHRRLRSLGHSLRAALGGSSGNTLAGGLLGLWND